MCIYINVFSLGIMYIHNREYIEFYTSKLSRILEKKRSILLKKLYSTLAAFLDNSLSQCYKM